MDKKIFYYFMELTIHNCYILYKAKSGSAKMTLYQFHHQLAREMLHQPPTPAEDAASDDNTVPSSKSTKHDSANRLSGGFKSLHMLTYPATAKKMPSASLQIVPKKWRSQRHKILLQRMQCALMQGSLLQQLPFLQKRLVSSKKLLDLKLFEA